MIVSSKSDSSNRDGSNSGSSNSDSSNSDRSNSKSSKGSHPKKNMFLFWVFYKGCGWSCPNLNVLRNFLVLFMFGKFFSKWEGVA